MPPAPHRLPEFPPGWCPPRLPSATAHTWWRQRCCGCNFPCIPGCSRCPSSKFRPALPPWRCCPPGCPYRRQSSFPSAAANPLGISWRHRQWRLPPPRSCHSSPGQSCPGSKGGLPPIPAWPPRGLHFAHSRCWCQYRIGSSGHPGQTSWHSAPPG